MIKRRDINKLIGSPMTMRFATNEEIEKGQAHHGDIVFTRFGKIVVVVHPDNLFDQDGNRFMGI